LMPRCFFMIYPFQKTRLAECIQQEGNTALHLNFIIWSLTEAVRYYQAISTSTFR
jgi:hypothetical protein